MIRRTALAVLAMLPACALNSQRIEDDQPFDPPPVAADDVLVTTMGHAATIDLLANDSDPQGGKLTVKSFTLASHGSVAIAGSMATYVPVASFVGTDRFTYTIVDPLGASATA